MQYNEIPPAQAALAQARRQAEAVIARGSDFIDPRRKPC
jgi:hypothetical protein